MDKKDTPVNGLSLDEAVHWKDLFAPDEQKPVNKSNTVDLMPDRFVAWRNASIENPLNQWDINTGPLSWNDVALSASVHPECETEARSWISRLMGYIPMTTICQPNMPFMQALIHQYQNDLIDGGTFIDEIIIQVTQIKNRDMIRNGWLDDNFEREALFNQYETYLVQYKDAARERHCRMLQSEPDLICSIPGELLIRELFVPKDHEPPVGEDFHAADFKAATITRYRERYWYEGPESANESQELFAFILSLRKQSMDD
ncbi:MAG: hypothetical protein NTW29_01675 [Bacteroidetes bacterium]|nr:hypothetical protein [Bacteroidota bacterium]